MYQKYLEIHLYLQHNKEHCCLNCAFCSRYRDYCRDFPVLKWEYTEEPLNKEQREMISSGNFDFIGKAKREYENFKNIAECN